MFSGNDSVVYIDGNDRYENAKYKEIMEHRARELSEKILKEFAHFSHENQQKKIPLEVLTFVKSGWLALTPSQLEEFKKNEIVTKLFSDPGFAIKYQPVFPIFENIKTRFDDSFNELEGCITSCKEKTEADKLDQALLQEAEELLKKLRVVVESATLLQLPQLQKICLLTKMAIERQDKAIYDLYNDYYKKFSGECSLSEVLWARVRIFLGILALTVSALFLAASFVDPICLLPMLMTGVIGAVLISSGNSTLRDEKNRAEAHKYHQGANVMRMFNRHIHGRSTDKIIVEREDASPSSKIRLGLIGGIGH